MAKMNTQLNESGSVAGKPVRGPSRSAPSAHKAVVRGAPSGRAPGRASSRPAKGMPQRLGGAAGPAGRSIPPVRKSAPSPAPRPRAIPPSRGTSPAPKPGMRAIPPVRQGAPQPVAGKGRAIPPVRQSGAATLMHMDSGSVMSSGPRQVPSPVRRARQG